MGDRFDAKYVKDLDAMHFITPYIMPQRCDNEVFFSFQIDLTNINEYIKKKNADNPDYKYNLFQCIITATLKTIMLRSKLSLFIHDHRMYKRNEVSTAFTVKQEFKDNGGEVLAFIHAKPEWNIDDVHNEIRRQLLKLKDREYRDESSGFMETFNRLPKFISRPIVGLLCWLEKHSLCPKALIETDPYHSTCLFANLCSIGLPDGFHHLSNWGTTSLFVVIGKAGRMPFFENDEVVFKDGVRLGFTIDERIADGFYFARSIEILKLFLQEPELLERPLNEKLSDELWARVTAKK